MKNAVDLWTRAQALLRERVPDATWRTWLSSLAPLSFENGELLLSAPGVFLRDRVEHRFLGLLTSAVEDAAGHPVTVRVDVARVPPPDVPPSPLPAPTAPPDLAQPSAPIPIHGSMPHRPLPSTSPATPPGALSDDRTSRSPIPAGLDPRYTFDAFVIGSSNRFAHAAALSVAETPAHSYNPLFVYGDAGLGKTHLLHAIGNYVQQNFLGSQVRYVSTETMMNEFVDAIRNNTTAVFKRRYRSCDVLLLDDIQFLGRSEQLQEEFFHTFNHLYHASKQMVLTSDRPPNSITPLEDRLRSRFLSGLITDVKPPELETRLAILRKKVERETVTIPEDVLQFIATNVTDNIRELEGALIRVVAYGSLNRQDVTYDLAKSILSDIVHPEQPRTVTKEMILDTTAKTFGFTVDDLVGPSRRRPLVTARQIGMYVFRELTDFSYPAIAREFGDRDHTTVIHAVEKIRSQMKAQRHIYDQVTELILRIKAGS